MPRQPTGPIVEKVSARLGYTRVVELSRDGLPILGGEKTVNLRVVAYGDDRMVKDQAASLHLTSDELGEVIAALEFARDEMDAGRW